MTVVGATQVVEGTLKPDGTLELRDSIRLPPGQVRVTVEAVPASGRPSEDWWSYLERARAELEAEGATFSTGEEIHRFIEQLRSDREPTDPASCEPDHRERDRGHESC